MKKAEPASPAPNPRERAKRHLKALLQAAAIAGAAIAAESCGPVVCDPLPPPMDGGRPDADGDGVTVEDGDCDDNDFRRSPSNVEVCGNKTDDDCNGLTDEGCPPSENGTDQDRG